jgi:2-hydroxychromene-2-carboxylate isomerase
MYPRKGAYARRDWDRTARLHEHAYRLPEPFGRSSLPAAAIAYRAEADGGPRMLKAFCRAVMAAYFTRNEAIDDVGVLIPLAAEAGLATDRARAAPDDPTMQAAVASATQTALDEGIWGAPVMVVDGEPFWGEDRIDQLDLWLARGGW